eukprot:CAMPEP_0179323224 /NCGR_PEP_ID=MMETSP0797-20121207/59599_1 /TAXON_ID=47934 /ORGANISM="Dinophysis acuminata, Strain DAEP01" /LENGTH=92 /DNA_ID=CAMNT_0021035037 /DNA_START=3 /DNA_END=278 /DNA_ORIENTATION=-
MAGRLLRDHLVVPARVDQEDVLARRRLLLGVLGGADDDRPALPHDLEERRLHLGALHPAQQLDEALPRVGQGAGRRPAAAVGGEVPEPGGGV